MKTEIRLLIFFSTYSTLSLLQIEKKEKMYTYWDSKRDHFLLSGLYGFIFHRNIIFCAPAINAVTLHGAREKKRVPRQIRQINKVKSECESQQLREKW